MGRSVVCFDEGGHASVELLHAGLIDQAEIGQGVAAGVEHIAVTAAGGVEKAQLGAGLEHALGVLLQVGEGGGVHGGP